jgi:hypothetical protein
MRDRGRFIEALHKRPNADKYVYGLANTLHYLVGLYIRSEARLPSVSEFMSSPYNVLLPEAWINPYTGEEIRWVSEPTAGHIGFGLPPPYDRSPHIVAWIERFGEAERFSLLRMSPEIPLGIWPVHPSGHVFSLTTSEAESVRKDCERAGYSIGVLCTKRRHDKPKLGYTEQDWQTFIAARALEGMFNQLEGTFDRGLPASLEEAQGDYWWIFNMRFRNAFTGAPIKEVPFGTNSTGDFIYRSDYGKSGPTPTRFLPVGIGKDGRLLDPLDHPYPDMVLMALARANYVRGLEGRSVCELWREKVQDAEKDRYYQAYCPAYDKVFLNAPPR